MIWRNQVHHYTKESCDKDVDVLESVFVAIPSHCQLYPRVPVTGRAVALWETVARLHVFFPLPPGGAGVCATGALDQGVPL